jgi:hypothetical protein
MSFISTEMLKNYITNTPMDKKLESNWKSYSKTLSLSKEIYLDVFGEPKTHAEWADSFNKIGRINRLIIKHTNGGNNNKNS